MASVASNKWLDWAFRILSVLVIPLLIWGITLEVGLAVQNEKITRLEQDVAAAITIRVAVAKNVAALGRVEEKIDATNKRLDEIRDDFHRGLPPKQ